MPTLRFPSSHAVLPLLLAVFLWWLVEPVTAQILGGTSPGQSLPTEVTPAKLAGSAYGGDVNLFTGSYQGSYALGTVATPGGLSYSLALQYGSTFSGGTDVPVARGIPYGEGWNLNLPMISVTSAVYQTQGDGALCQYFAPVNSTNYDSLNAVDLNDGDLYWYAPEVNIPGVVSGRAVYKYSKGGTPVFVLNAFERYVELEFHGSSWKLILDDGTVYTFGHAKQSYRHASNKRGFAYDAVNPRPYSASGAATMDQGDAYRLRNLIMPKAEVLQWYCSGISQPNLPSNQAIVFDYHTFGRFNYFREYSQSWQRAVNTSLGQEFDQQMPFADMDVYTDVILKSVQSISTTTIDRIDLEYASEATIGTDMLDFR
ncbi:MAG: hypothetical protein AAGB22_13690, partial [Bacteroidota bacterium]